MITMPEIICDLFSFLDKDQIERIQLVNQFWNNVIIRHKNILPLRQFAHLSFYYDQYMRLYATEEDSSEHLIYKIKFDGTNLSKIEEDEKWKDVSSRYSKLTVDEVLTNLNDVVFDTIVIVCCDSEHIVDIILNMIKLVTAKTGGRFRGKFGRCSDRRFGPKTVEIFDNYIIVDELALDGLYDSDFYIREVCANPEIVQLPSTPKEIRLAPLKFKKNENILHFACNGKLTIHFETSSTNYGNFIRQWFELYRTHQNPISLVRKFQLVSFKVDSALSAVKTFLNNIRLRVKYSLETKVFRHPSSHFTQYLKRSCVLHETDSYALVIEMAYKTDLSSIKASDLDKPTCYQLKIVSFCVKPL